MAKSNNTDLILYAEKGNLPKMKQLISEGADIEPRDQKGFQKVIKTLQNAGAK